MKYQILFLLFLILASCKDDPSSPQYNPCEGKHPVSADFDMYEKGNTHSFQKSDNDTIFSGNNIIIEAKYDCDYYEWNLSGDTTNYYKKNVNIGFDINENRTISVRLITKSKIDSVCFPNDDGIDTVL